MLEEASAGRRPDGDATVGEVLKQYAAVADWGLSTREANEGYIRRTILPALGEMKLRRVRGPVLDTLYARLRKCSNLACTGKPFVEHTRFPMLALDTSDRRPAWQQVADTIREAIQVGQLMAGDPLPSVRGLAEQHGVRVATLQRALKALDEQGFVSIRQGRAASLSVPAESITE